MILNIFKSPSAAVFFFSEDFNKADQFLTNDGKIMLKTFKENTDLHLDYSAQGFLVFFTQNDWKIKRIAKSKIDLYSEQDCYITEYDNKYFAVYF